MATALAVALPGLLIWAAVLLLPSRPWAIRETLDAEPVPGQDLSELTVLIPARNEAETLTETLTALQLQGDGLRVILVDDQSTDQTAARARAVALAGLNLIQGEPAPPGWHGKPWALEQGRRHVKTPYLLLLDADIVLKPGLIQTLLYTAKTRDLHLLSLMARLHMVSVPEKLLLPAFIFFFRLLYPFHRANDPSARTAAAAGGCLLLKTATLNALGGFACIKDALIDDCALARAIKRPHRRTWTGLTHSAVSIRKHQALPALWQMVTRTAYTQLRHSAALLLACTVLMLAAFALPLAALAYPEPPVMLAGLAALCLQAACYLPCLRYYGIAPGYALSLPITGLLYLVMTWHSALNHCLGHGAHWKGRRYR